MLKRNGVPEVKVGRGVASGVERYLLYSTRNIDKPRKMRRVCVRSMRARRGRVMGGEVETVYSTVVGEGRRVRR